MSVRVSSSNRAAQPARPGIRAPGLQKLSLGKSVVAIIGLNPIPINADAALGSVAGNLSPSQRGGSRRDARISPSPINSDAPVGSVAGVLL